MPEHPVRVSLEIAGEAPTTADGTLVEFTPMERMKHGLGMLAGTLVLTVIIAFIPIVHLIGVPLVFIGGITLAVIQMRATARLEPLRLPCPKCGGVNRLGGGFGVAQLAEATPHMCENCRRELVLRVVPEPTAPAP